MSDLALQGNLGVFRLPEVLTFLGSTRKTGLLTVSSDGKQAQLYFDQGALIHAGSNQEAFRLAAILLRKKKITREQWQPIDDLMTREGGRFGELAVKHGLLTEAQVRDFLKIQVSEIVYDCFVWRSGSFAFSDTAELPSHAITIAVDLSNLIMEGARRIEEWEECVRLLPDASAVFRVVASPKDDKITLSAGEWRILFMINGQRTLEQLVHDSEDGALSVYRIVYGLLSNNLIEPVRPHEPDDTNGPWAREQPTNIPTADSTIRQERPNFAGESTIVEMPDDTALIVSTDAHLSYSDVVRPVIAQLTITTGDDAGTVCPLADPEYTLGRRRENTIVVPDLGVSGFHARIFRTSEGYVIEDLKSRNGTWINGERIGERTLHDGDEIQIGGTKLNFALLFDAQNQG